MSDGQMLLLVAVAVVSFVLSWIGAAIGSVLGHLRLPLLVALFDSPVLGASVNMAISGFGALAGAMRHASAGRVSWRLVVLMGVPSVLGAMTGMIVLLHIPRFWGHVSIGAMLVYAGWSMIPGRTSESAPAARPMPFRALVETAIGLGIGLLASITGLLLGSLRLPILIRWLNVDPALAVGSNMMIGFLTAASAALTSLAVGAEHGTLTLVTMAVVVPPTILGGYLGARFTDRLSRTQLLRLIGSVVAVTGVLMVAQGFWGALATLDFESVQDAAGQDRG